MLSELGVYLKPSTYSMDTKPLLKEACTHVFGSSSGLVDMLVEHVPSSRRATAGKVGGGKEVVCVCVITSC